MPLRAVLHSPSQSGRLAKWTIELSEYDIEHRKKTCTKSQVLADFIVELPTKEARENPLDTIWLLHVDGSLSKQGLGVGIRLTSHTSGVLEQSFTLNFEATNNVPEYEALVAGLNLARRLKIAKIRAFCDSQLVANKFNGEYTARDERMETYLAHVQNQAKQFDEFELTRIPQRGKYIGRRPSCFEASTSDPNMRRVIPVEFIKKPNSELDKEEHAFPVQAAANYEDASDDGSGLGCDSEWIEPI